VTLRSALPSLVAILLLVAARPLPPAGDLVLDAADPVVAVEIAGVPMRLRVDLSVQGPVELNPAAAARLPLRWEADLPLDVGRVRLFGRVALADLRLADGRTVPVQLADHRRECCAGVDGAVPPGLLPYRSVSWRRADAPEPTAALVLPLRFRDETGYEGDSGVAGVSVRFDPFRPDSLATAAAGARLSRAWGGRWDGPPGSRMVAFGVARPVRPLAFDRPGSIAGFPIAGLPVRLADFAGHGRLPADPTTPDEIVVSRRVDPQHAWPAVTLGDDRLRRCREIRFTARPLALTLRCAPA
jgi:hypothetical protein